MKITLGRSADGNTIEITSEQLDHHLYMLGKSGMGKTSCLCNICTDLMRAEPKAGLCVIDPLGALVEEIKRRIPDHRVNDVILFEARDQEYPFSLNPFAPEPPAHLLGQWADHVMSIFQLICDDADWNSRTKQALRNIVITLLSRSKIEGPMGEEWPAALDEVSALLNLEVEEDGDKPRWRKRVTSYRGGFYSSLEESGQIPVLRFWREFYDKVMTPRPKADISAAIGGAADQHLANPIVRNIVGQTQTKINFLDVMDEGKILLVDLSGIGDDSANFLGSVIMAQLASSTLQRERYAEPHFYIVADELYRYGNEAFRYISRQGRNFNVHLIAAQQDQTDMRPWQRGLMGNASNRLYFQLVPSDAMEQAREFDCTPPLAEFEFRQRFRLRLGEGARVLRDNGRAAIDVFRRIRDGESVAPHEQVVARKWLSTYSIWSRRPRVKAAFQRMAESEHLEVDDKWIQSLEEAHVKLEARDEDDFDTFIQDQMVYPETRGTFHYNYPPGGGVGESVSSEIGARYEITAGRSRSYSDLYQQIANDLTHLPRQHAKCQLAALDDDPPIEATVKIRQLEPESADWAQRWASIKERSQREYSRPVEEVEEEAKRRATIMRRAVETWHSQNGGSREYHADGDGLKSANGDPLVQR